MNKNPFIKQTHETPRPTEQSHGKGGRLADLQKQWDDAEDKRVGDEAYQARRRAEKQARRAAGQEAGAALIEGHFVDGLRARYLAADPAATEADFLRDLPEIRRQQRIAEALSGPVDPARIANARRYS